MDDWRCMVWSNPGASCKVRYSDKLVIWTHWQAFSTIAKHIAGAASASKAILIDCFAGVGGNVIAFAQSERWKRVYAIEKDPRALACAKHNAEIYGVRDRISWYEGDCFEILRNELVELGPHSIVFASPPWGGKLILVRYKASLTICRSRIQIGQSLWPRKNAALHFDRSPISIPTIDFWRSSIPTEDFWRSTTGEQIKWRE